ncbi:hypothetical protein [Eisenbergiella porci]|uniref:hypothetical protein n=1 Tax=Eisenbergiella porci TaxID=2652274 RepID=UPI002A8371D3|nr:hypothetical protein [Eisenbergiella porci]
MMKKNHAARLGALALALTLVSTCLMGGTLAKYTTTVTGTATAMVAKWSFDAKNDGKSISTASYSIDLGKTTNRTVYDATDVKEDVIAPGTEGSFSIIVDATDSDVGLAYTIKFSNAQNIPTNLSFYTDKEHNNKITNLFSNENKDFDGIINANGTEKEVTKTVYWMWPFGSTNNDAADTANGKSDNRKMTFDITVTGTQVEPEKTSAP